MASDDHAGSRIELYDSSLTVPSDSENYSANNEMSSSPPSTSSSPLILYRPPTLWSILRGAAINLVLPFVNGLMLGLGELLAHEAAFRLGWSGTKVCLFSVLADFDASGTETPSCTFLPHKTRIPALTSSCRSSLHTADRDLLDRVSKSGSFLGRGDGGAGWI